MRFACMFVVLATAGFTSSPAHSQEAYPSRPITLIVSFPPGGVVDLVGRPLATAMEKRLKQPIGIANRAGASGAVGNSAVANARPDGYTLLITPVSFSTIPVVDELFGRKPAYVRDQFTPIAQIAADPPILAIGASQPWKSLKELVTDAKSRPGQILFSSSGLYGPTHLPMAMFLHAADIEVRHLPLVGAPASVAAVLGGHSTMLASPASLVGSHTQAGKLRLFATWGAQRNPYFKDVPTFKELGYDIEFYLWIGMFAPANLPGPVLKTLRDTVKQAVEDPSFKAAMDKAQILIAHKEGAEYQKFLDDDAKTLAAVIRRIGRVEEKKGDKK
jgi:tripartite-type tricarboxylate transporter receptor subunit TctC